MTLIQKLKNNAKALKTEVVALYFAMKDQRTPLLAKVMIVITVSYALSPIDIIPDFIPVVGYLDDLIILPVMILISIKLIPQQVLLECRIKANQHTEMSKKIGLYAAIFIILIWIGLIAYIVLNKVVNK